MLTVLFIAIDAYYYCRYNALCALLDFTRGGTMPVDMAEKIRLVLMVDEEVRAALRLAAGKRSAADPDGNEVSMGMVLEDIVRQNLADEIGEVRRAREKRRKGG
jgi:hypothetical protein